MNLDDLESRLQEAKSPVIVTGAGVSTLSGVPDYSTMEGTVVDGISFEAREVLSRPFFIRYPRVFWSWHKEHFLQPLVPNKVHRWISKQNVPVITQNIDGLHRKAGSKEVVEFHGKADKGRCLICYEEVDLTSDDAIFKHQHRANLKTRLDILADHFDTSIVLYGDGIDPNNLAISQRWLTDSDLIIVIGSSLEVHPLAGLVLRQDPQKIIWLDKKKNEIARHYPDIVFIESSFESFFAD